MPRNANRDAASNTSGRACVHSDAGEAIGSTLQRSTQGCNRSLLLPGYTCGWSICGRTTGSVRALPSYFKERGFPCPAHYNPADHVMTIMQARPARHSTHNPPSRCRLGPFGRSEWRRTSYHRLHAVCLRVACCCFWLCVACFSFWLCVACCLAVCCMLRSRCCAFHVTQTFTPEQRTKMVQACIAGEARAVVSVRPPHDPPACTPKLYTHRLHPPTRTVCSKPLTSLCMHGRASCSRTCCPQCATWCNTAALVSRPKGARRGIYMRMQPPVSKQNSDVASPRRAAAATRAAAAMRAAAAAAALTCRGGAVLLQAPG